MTGNLRIIRARTLKFLPETLLYPFGKMSYNFFLMDYTVIARERKTDLRRFRTRMGKYNIRGKMKRLERKRGMTEASLK